MTAALPLLLASVLGAGGRLDLGLGSEAGLRWSEPPMMNGDRRTLGLTLTPRVGLHLIGAPLSAELTYRPRFSIQDLGPHRSFENYHEGELRLRLEPNDVWRLEPYAVGGFGRTDLVTLSRLQPTQAGPPGQTQTIATTSILDLRSVRAGAALHLRLDARSELLLSAEGGVSGGRTARSKASLPTEHTATGTIQYDWSATRLDRVGLRVTATHSRIPAMVGESAVGNALATWQRRLARDVDVSLGAGAVGFYSSYPLVLGQPARVVSRNVRPSAELTLSRTGGAEELSATLSGRLGATSDRLTGRASQDANGSLLLSYPASAWLRLHARGDGSMSWPAGGQVRRGGLDTGGDLRLGPSASVTLSGYGTWQRSTTPAAPTLTEYGVLLGLTLRAQTLAW
jgi:hypothetical protein